MFKSFSIPQLAEHCQTEATRYKRTGQSDETYCLELFRRALVEHNEEAWQVIYTQYQPLVATWVLNFSRFPQTGEEAAFFINGAFVRMWRRFASRTETAPRLDSLGQCLKFLKMCVWSAIEDYHRQNQRDVLGQAKSLEDNQEFLIVTQGDAPTHPALSPFELRRLLEETIQSETEHLVAEASWIDGLAPRQVQARYPDTFATVEQVSQIKHNLLKRLRRRLKVRD